MNRLVELHESPSADYMIAGWYQWADAGDVSSGLPQYLIDETMACEIGAIKSEKFYLFQIPGTHHLMRPTVVINEGYRQSLGGQDNKFFYAQQAEDGFLVFLGEEPHRNERQYANAFLDAVEELGVKRVAIVAGVHGPVPYDKDRQISCVYSLPKMKDELEEYAVKFSNYEGGATIGIYIAHQAEQRDLEVVTFYAMVPAYDFSTESITVNQVAMYEDHKAWYDIMQRLEHMFRLDIDLSDLKRRSEELIQIWDTRIQQLEEDMPQLDVGGYMKQINREFEERSFLPLSHAWEEAADDLFDSQP
jgi:proteasome assembly chaperone (PAC2) family protein